MGNPSPSVISRVSREWIFQYIPPSRQCTDPLPPKFWWSTSTDILFIINPSLGMDQEILPCRLMSIESIKSNPSLLMIHGIARYCMVLHGVAWCCKAKLHWCNKKGRDNWTWLVWLLGGVTKQFYLALLPRLSIFWQFCCVARVYHIYRALWACLHSTSQWQSKGTRWLTRQRRKREITMYWCRPDK